MIIDSDDELDSDSDVIIDEERSNPVQPVKPSSLDDLFKDDDEPLESPPNKRVKTESSDMNQDNKQGALYRMPV